MSVFLSLVFIFFIGSMTGWIIELFYRRLVHKKWVNPGFLVGPYLPIYGFGLCTITGMHMILSSYYYSSFIIILSTGLMMTLIELIGGLIFTQCGRVKLWDYSDRWLNYKGIICPLFSIIWTIIGGLYYYFLADSMINALMWFSNNLSFSFVLGVFFGVIILDFIYSARILSKIRKFAKDNNIKVRYEELKSHIQEFQKEAEKKYSFIFAFKQKDKTLHDYLIDYINRISEGR